MQADNREQVIVWFSWQLLNYYLTEKKNQCFLKKDRNWSSVKQLRNYFLTEKINSICTTMADFSSACIALLFQFTS